MRQNDLNGSANVRNVNFYRISDNHGLEFGAELKQQLDDFDYYAAAYTDYFGGHTPTLVVDNRITSPELGGFISYIASPTKRLTATLGIRSDYFEYTGHTSLSPRTALSWRLSDRTTLTGAFGIYSQTVPLVLLSQQTSNRRLKDPQAYHYVAGTEYMLNDNTRLRIESYYKWYKNFPLDVNQPQMFIIDEMIYANYFYYHRDLRDDGRARSYGIEATVQQKLKQRLYGLVSASWFRSQYRDLNGVWRNRSFDNRLLFSAEGGYKPSPKWEYSLRWIYAGGAPYTPLNIEASRALDRSVYDETRVNESRYPAYHSLNLRADRSFNFRNSNLIIYFSVWNAYNRKNLANLYWNEVQKKQQELYQWSLMPVIGAKYEF